MKENRSLHLSTMINTQMKQDLSGLFFDFFPFEKIQAIKPHKERDRVYSTENTLLTMVLTMVEQDKSLQNSVNIYSRLHERNMQRIEALQKQILNDSAAVGIKRKAGRPRTSLGRIAKSKTKSISRDTSGYSQARQRLSLEAVETVFREASDLVALKQEELWHGLRVFIADGTYLQMQDTEEINKEYRSSSQNAYPRALLEVVIEQSSGTVFDYSLGHDKKSELEILYGMLEKMPKKSLLLADDLYNCFAIFDRLRQKEIEIIVPGKRVRKYEVVQKIQEGDDIVRIAMKRKSKWLKDKDNANKTLLMRRIQYNSAGNKDEKRVLYSSLLDPEISKEDIILKYVTRWDIEISIREIKMIMDINIVRSKSVEMAQKEIATALIAYNYIRKIIAKLTESIAFPPKEDIIQKHYEAHTHLLVDKLGRKYSRWSPGRGGQTESGANKTHYTT